ncbi:MAG TPA: protein YgfX [Telluria sp.]
MSLAVSAVVNPSRLLRLALLLYACACLGAALALASGRAGNVVLPHWVALCCLLAAGAALRAFSQAKNTRRIDISGPGQIRVTVQQNVGSTSADGVPVQLIPGSTVWPSAMVLLLRAEDGAVTALTVLPDSVAPHQFRALAVAIRAIAGRNNSFFGANKIL